MSTIELTLGGDEITQDVVLADAVFESQADGQAGTCHFRIKDAGNIDGGAYGFPSNRIPRGTWRSGAVIELRIDSQLVWAGVAQSIAYQYAFDAENTNPDIGSHQRFLVIDGVDWNVLFTKRVVWNVAAPTTRVPGFTGTENDGDVVKQVMTDFMDLSGDGISDAGVINVGPLSPYGEAFNIADVGNPWGQAMSRIIASNGAIYYIDPDKVLQYRDVEVASAPFPIADQPAAVPSSVGFREMTVFSSATEMANDALVWGAGRGDDEVVFARVEDATSIATHGRLQWGDFRKDMWKAETVDRRADSYINGSPTSRRGHKDDRDAIKVVMFEPGLRVGMVVDFNSLTFGYQDNVPIRRCRITFPTPTDARFEFDLSHNIDMPFFFADPSDPVDPWIWETVAPGEACSQLFRWVPPPIAFSWNPNASISTYEMHLTYGRDHAIFTADEDTACKFDSAFNLLWRVPVYDEGSPTVSLGWIPIGADDGTVIYGTHGLADGDGGHRFTIPRSMLVVPQDEGAFWFMPEWPSSDLQVRSASSGAVRATSSLPLYGLYRARSTPDRRHVVIGDDDVFFGSVWVYDKDLNLVNTCSIPISPSASGQNAFPDVDFAVDNDFNIYAQGYGGPYNFISKFDPNGNALWNVDLNQFGFDLSGTSPPMGSIWYDFGVVYVAGNIDAAGAGTGWAQGQVGVIVAMSSETGAILGITRIPPDRAIDSTKCFAVVRDNLSGCLLITGKARGEYPYNPSIFGQTYTGLDAAGDPSRFGDWLLRIAPPGRPSTTPQITWLGGGLYRTTYPYVGGSMEVIIEGRSLFRGTEFQETNAPEGEFTLLGEWVDLSNGMSVHYRRADLSGEASPPPFTPPPEPGVPPADPGGGTRTYRPANQRQKGWGTPHDGVNCVFAASAMALDRHTMGLLTAFRGSPLSTPPNHRYYSGDPGGPSSFEYAVAAWRNGWGETLLRPGPVSWSYFVAQIQSGRGAMVGGLYRFMPEPFNHASNYESGHALYINEQLSDGSFWGFDPIINYPHIYPYNVLKTYMESGPGFNGTVRPAFTRVTPKI